jgi:8-oxo-dGTP pyrophosphatase MutT (NUDIX family)
MPGARRWEVLATERLQDCAVFSVSRLLSRSPRDGGEHAFFRIDASDWVNVVPITTAGDLVLIRQYRHGAGEITLEIPGGMVDPGETPAAAAARELLEETGYGAAELSEIGRSNPNPALFGNRLHSFVARGCERVDEVRNEGNEETAVELVARAELTRLVRGGNIDHALVLAGLYYLELFERG